MDDAAQEVEIKIEYSETNEPDPLCDKNVNNLRSNVYVGNDCLSKENDYPISIKKYHTNEDNLKAFEESCFNYDCEVKASETNRLDEIAQSEITWYDSIDHTGRLLCKFCNSKYSTLQTIRFHVKKKHPDKAKNIKENIVKYKRKSKLKCHICNQRFKEVVALKTHVNNNHFLKSIATSCCYCHASFATANDISDHMLIQHKKIIHKCKYICDICGYRTSTKSHFTQHKNTHIETKNRKCKYCDYATNYLPNLKIHERIHTNDKVYVCDNVNCNYRCSAKSALRSHQLKHSPKENTLYCDKCTYKTIYRQSLNRHYDCHRRNSLKIKLL